MNELNDWIVFSSIIYKIHTTNDDRKLREEFLEQLKMLVSFDSADFYLARQGASAELDGNPVLNNCNEAYTSCYDELDYSRGILYSGVCMAYRETDIITDDVRVKTEYYQRLYIPNGWHYSAQIILAYEKKFVGAATLYRSQGKENFTRHDVMLLDLLKDHLAYRLYTLQNKTDSPKSLNLHAFAEEFSLTHREETVLCAIWAGKDNNTISEELVISVHTLKKHILNIYRKTGVNKRSELINKVAKWSS